METKDEKAARLAGALRTNLKRRKERARGEAAALPARADSPETDA